MRLKPFFFSVILSMLFLFCAGQEQDPDAQIRTTARKIMRTFRTGTPAAFETILGMELSETGRDHAALVQDFNAMKHYIAKYHRGKNFQIDISNEYDSLGRLRVWVPVFTGRDTVAHLSNIRLELLFGPPYQISLDMISDYRIHLESTEKKKTPAQHK